MSRVLTEPEVLALGERLAERLPPGAVLWLEGDLGAGKTTLARALVAARGGDQGATSPTFALTHRYLTPRGPVFHVDCYRFRDEEEAGGLDWEELTGGNLLIVEWPTRGGAWIPRASHQVRLTHVDDLVHRRVEVYPDPAGWLHG